MPDPTEAHRKVARAIAERHSDEWKPLARAIAAALAEAVAADDTLSRLARLPENWDSYGGKPPTEAALKVARGLSWSPSTNGGLQAALFAGGLEIEIDIEPDGAVSVNAAAAIRARGEP